MPTMQDIAKKAGVSSATVSRVINGNGKVSEKKRIRIIECMKALNYHPNAAAQSLARNQSFLLGVIVPNIKNPFFGEILENIARTAQYNGYGIIFCNSDNDINKEKNKLDLLRNRHVDGILIAPVEKNSDHISYLKTDNIPTVIITQDLKGFNSISISHITGAELVAQHFIDLGLKKIGYVGLKKDIKYISFKKFLNKFNIELKNRYYISCKGRQNAFLESYYATQKKLNDEAFLDIEAIFAFNDLAALGAVTALKDYGYKIPDNVSVAGFDNTFLAAESTPELTSIAQPVNDIGRIAVEIILESITSKKAIKSKNIILQPKLVERESTLGVNSSIQ